MGKERAAGVREQVYPNAPASPPPQPERGAEPQPAPAAELAPEDGVVAAAPAATDTELAPEDDGPPPGETVAGDLEELLAKATQRDEYLALAQRTQADFENYRKRVARDAGAAESRGLGRLARELLPALDNLDRALAAATDADQVLVEGLRLVQRELLGALERVGIESYGAAGEPFDPELHEAVAQQPFEGKAPGEIVEVYQAGYRLAGGVIRPARVLVAG